jgi:hypothetical protein
MICPEEMAKVALNITSVRTKADKALFFEDAFVVLFDSLIIFKGNLNMQAAIPRLLILADALGLPIAVIENKELSSIKEKKRRPNKFIGPGFWFKHRSWDSEDGLDGAFLADYTKDGKLTEADDDDDDDEWDEETKELYEKYGFWG